VLAFAQLSDDEFPTAKNKKQNKNKKKCEKPLPNEEEKQAKN